MSALIDTSVLVAAMISSEAYHRECQQIVAPGGALLYQHGIVEAFNSLTGGGKPFRLQADEAQALLKEDYTPRMQVIVLTPEEVLEAMGQCRARGVRGGAIYDFLHLTAARKAGASRLYTLNMAHFRAFHRAGDPEIVHP